jgi:hypothetical protein
MNEEFKIHKYFLEYQQWIDKIYNINKYKNNYNLSLIQSDIVISFLKEMLFKLGEKIVSCEAKILKENLYHFSKLVLMNIPCDPKK